MSTTAYKRIGATTAIAAALALTPAIAAAQQADSTTSTTSTTTESAAPADAAPADAAPAPTADVAPTPDVSTSAAAPVGTRHVTRTVTTRTVHVAPHRAEAPPPVAVAPVQTAPAAAPLSAAPPPPPPADASLTPAEPVATAPAPVPTQPQSHFGETLLELGAGLIGLIALAWIALALFRRRRVRDQIDEYEYAEPAAEPVAEPVVAPVAVAEPVAPVEPEPPATDGTVTSRLRVTPAASYFSDRPAFDWGDKSEGAESASTEDDRLPGESWTERAHRGPSADNPSLSLKKRLKRAAFFEHREREAAEGRAVPVDPDAGLPESITDDSDLQAA